jgi:hypothetical protein
MVIGVLVLLVSGEFHEMIFPEVGSVAYLLGGAFLFGGALSWILVIRREKALRAAEQTARLAPPKSSQVIQEISSHGNVLKMAGLGVLMYVGVLLNPWGLLLSIGAGALWLHGYRSGWFTSKEASLHIFNGPVRIGGELQAEIVLPTGLAPTGGGNAFLWCEQRTFRRSGSRGDRDYDFEVIPLMERECHFVLDDAWRQTDQGLAVGLRIPVRVGQPSQGDPDPRVHAKSSVVWILKFEIPLEKDRYGAMFYVPVEAAQ